MVMDEESISSDPVRYAEAWRGGDEAMRRRRLRAAFDRRDTNGSGFLEKKELTDLDCYWRVMIVEWWIDVTRAHLWLRLNEMYRIWSSLAKNFTTFLWLILLLLLHGVLMIDESPTAYSPTINWSKSSLNQITKQQYINLHIVNYSEYLFFILWYKKGCVYHLL